MTIWSYGYSQAMAAYLCAMEGHVYMWTSNHTGYIKPPPGSHCYRCGERLG